MASSSGSFTEDIPSGNLYRAGHGVFLSYTQADSPRVLARHLYPALKNVGIRVFRDEQPLFPKYLPMPYFADLQRAGPFRFSALNDPDCHIHDYLYDTTICVYDDDMRLQRRIAPELLEAIKRSKVSIPGGFALKKLALMMRMQREKGQLFLTILFDATDRFQRSEGFAAHRLNEAQAIKLVVAEVLRIVGRPMKSHNLVGIDDNIEEIMRLLNIDDENDLRMVGIHGTGGIGKTTLASIIYGNISNQFGGCSFIKSVRDMWSEHDGLSQLQRLVLKHILKHEHEHSDHVGDVTYQFHRNLRSIKALIVLDDVDDAKQITELAGNLDWFGSGSRIIVTTRNRDVLPKFEGVYEYQVKELHQHDAFLLFCKTTFQQDSPPDQFVARSREIVEATKGLPLSIESIGSYLFAENDSVWKGALHRLKIEPRVQDRLMISYNILDDNQKQIFLDMACFFVGSFATIPAHMWRHCKIFPEDGTADVLRLMSLIKIGDDNKISVHDHFRDLAREIVHRENISKPGERSRLWGQDAVKLLKNKKGTKKVQAIRLDCEKGLESYIIKDDDFKGLANLRYLDLGNCQCQPLTPQPGWLAWLGTSLPQLSNLRWLGWHGNTEFYVQPNVGVRNLVVLDLSKSTIKETWTGWSLLKEAKNLEVLDLTGCHHLKRTPNLSSFPRMKRLILRDCILLDKIDASVGDLKMLISLDLRNCSRLKNLPENLGSLQQLFELLLDESSIEELPNNLSGLISLETFSARSCKLLHRIPESFGSLVRVQKILLDNCKSLADIPPNIGELELLQELSLSSTKVMHLPDSIGKLSNLEVLNIDHSPIRKLPTSLWNLRKLQVLNASGCVKLAGEILLELENLTSLRILRLDHTNIDILPEAIERLPHLHTLNLEGCLKLQSLPKLPFSLVNLKVTLTSSVAVPNLADLIHLKSLELQRCNSSFIPKHPQKDWHSSSSSDSIQPGYEYEVFLSFRGPDTRKSFTDVLYQKLIEVGVRTFRDNEELHVGEEIGGNLLQAINQSKISIPIFSRDYASSKWCLMEAAKMVECMETRKQKVFPIFFDVTVDEVKHQTGCYAQSFSEHMKSEKHDANIIEGWRNALKKIGARKGKLVGASASSSWGQVLKEVVSKILNKLKKPYLDVSENLVGIEDHMEGVVRLLDTDANDVRMIGLWGMGGIGKTTITKFVFNQLANQFEYRGSIENIRGASIGSERFIASQTQLASDILRYKFENFSSHSEGKSVLETRLREKKVLILIDDVDQTKQLEYLVGNLDWFGPGSRILVTTREVDVLRKSKVKWFEYEVEEMTLRNAFLLFCKHAFRQDFPIPEFESMSLDIVEATGGLPLAIEAIGSSLSITSPKKVWEEARNSLKTKKDIHEKLEVSYDALNREQQEVFLDIACLFKGTDQRIPLHLWKARQFSAETILQDLLSRSLIKIRDDHILWMHDCFIDLGREIVRKKSDSKLGKQSRLWCSKDATKVLEAKIGTEEVKAIHLDCGSDSQERCYGYQHFEKLSYLEFLGLGDAGLSGDFQGSLSSLIWLSWNGGNLLDTPSGLDLKNLVILDLSKSEINSDWKGWSLIKEAKNLEVLNLSGCHQLTRTPDLSTFSSMKRLILKDCRGLVDVSPSIGELENLEFIDLRNCSSLKQLPQEFGHLVALTELLLDGSSIQELPISGDMKNLKMISAKSCGLLAKLPFTIGELKSLKELNLSRTGVVYLPDTLENLTSLEVLNIDHSLIQILPVSLWKLRQLVVINASSCRNLKGEIPCDLGCVDSLKVLRLDRTGVTGIPESITELSVLRTLDLTDCMKLHSLPTLPSSLVELKVTLTSSQVEPHLQDLVNLKELEIVYCGELSKVLMDIEKFSKIEKVTITKRHARGL